MLSRFVAVRLANPKKYHHFRMRDMDKDNSGEVDFDEFYVWWKVHSTASPGLFKRIFGR